MSEINASELLKIEEFRKKLQPLGIYGIYKGVSEFEDNLRKHLTKFSLKSTRKRESQPLNTEQLINKEALRKYLKRNCPTH